MTMFYTARHAAPRAHRSAAQRTGAGVLAATALGLGASTMTATSAAAQGGPEAPAPATSQTASTGAEFGTGVCTGVTAGRGHRARGIRVDACRRHHRAGRRRR